MVYFQSDIQKGLGGFELFIEPSMVQYDVTLAKCATETWQVQVKIGT